MEKLKAKWVELKTPYKMAAVFVVVVVIAALVG